MTTTSRKPAKIIYARISTDDKNQTIETQRSAIINAGHGDTEIMFADEGVSGKVAPHNRPAFARLLKLAQPGDTIVVTALDRLSRSTVDAINLMEELAARDISVISLREQRLSTDTTEGRFLLGLAALLAERERGLISDRTKQGIERAREQGKRIGRPGITDEQREQAETMFNAGATVAEVMTATGLKKTAVYGIKASLSAAE